MQLDDAEVPELRRDILYHQFDAGEALVWAPDHAYPLALDSVAHVVFQLIDGVGTVGDLIADVHEVVGIPQQMAAERIRSALRVLNSGGLLKGSSLVPPRDDPYFLLGPPNT